MKKSIWMRALALVLVFAMTDCGAAKGGASQKQNSKPESVISTESAGAVPSEAASTESISPTEEPEDNTPISESTEASLPESSTGIINEESGVYESPSSLLPAEEDTSAVNQSGTNPSSDPFEGSPVELGYGGCTAAAIGLAPLVGLTGALSPQRWERIFKGTDIIKSNR